jgi:hypothetical protein
LAHRVFAGGTGGLSAGDQIDIARALDLRLSADRSLVDGTCGQPVASSVRFQDLNGDGIPEVVIESGNTCTSGLAGTSVWAFVRDPEGRYRPSLGFPGMIAEIRPARDGEFSELLIGGPGFCFGVWRWDGRAYVHARNEPQEPGGCAGR